MSTRATPVGGYPTRGPLNFRMWNPNKPAKLAEIMTSRRQKTKPKSRMASNGRSIRDELEPVALPADILTLDGSR